MKNFEMSLFLVCVLFSSVIIKGYGQESQITDTLHKSVQNPANVPTPVKKVLKNSIMINVTNPSLISSQFKTIGYERVLPHNQSVTVNFGKFSIPKFFGGVANKLGLNTEYKDKGFHFSTDYRFYITKENKFAAPKGVYVGPYYSFNSLNRANSWTVEGFDEEVFTDLKFKIHTVGVEMGYQFVFWNRLALDVIFLGPGYGIYDLKAELDTNLDEVEEAEFFDKLNQILAETIPGYDLVIEPGDFNKTGTYKLKTVGLRYAIRVGFRF